MANYSVYAAETRGFANHGWLKANHYFSFANYYNPKRMNFGVIRVFNDDAIAGGMGFGTHPHDNMEIITIPLEGSLTHKDSMGNTAQILPNEVQVMSAGTGVSHSEFNSSPTDLLKLFQIWLFPHTKNVSPRYDQRTLDPADRKNKLQQILSPSADDEGVWIHQDAWFHRGDFESGLELSYTTKKAGNGLLIVVISGQIQVEDHILNSKDAIGITDIDLVNIRAISDADVLVLDVPMA
jgi:quercetin 2,3-dioxygenase